MSASAPPPGFVPPPPPPGLNYIAAIKPSLTLLMIGTVWSSMLIPLLIALVFFSNRTLRRQPLFIMNLISVLAGITLGIMNVYLEATAMLSPLTPIKGSIFIGFVCLNLYLPVYMDIILLFRLYVVYPPRSLSWLRRAVVFGPPILFKIIRIANLMVFLIKWTRLINGRDSPLEAGQALWGSQPWTKIEWFFQVFDNCYASTLFILRVQKGRTVNSQTSASTGGKKQSHASKLQSLFFIALGNFVFPCMLSLVQLIFLFRDPNFLDGTYVFITNCYVEIIGVLLATIWVAGGQWAEDHQLSGTNTTHLSTMRYDTPKMIRIGRSVVTDSTVGRSTVDGDHGMELDAFRAAPRKFSGSEDRAFDGSGKEGNNEV
ncbi:hypothetical protein FB451DRAFT_1287754 [Mycena latifolia]|nr:hypothetical protein FB451DRAFT_1287754 [Mycena latifolia]